MNSAYPDENAVSVFELDKYKLFTQVIYGDLHLSHVKYKGILLSLQPA